MMARVPGKRLLPTELLRRSTRGQKTKHLPTSGQTSTQESHGAIKLEPLEFTPSINESVGNLATAKKVKLESEQSHVVTINNKEKVNNSLKPDGFMEIDQEELDLERTLLGGQSFRWVKENHQPEKDGGRLVFTGTISGNVLQLWRCDTKHIAYRKLNASETDDKRDSKGDIETLLSDYFHLKYKLKDLYEYWSKRDENFDKCSRNYQGFRILRQDPVENVFCFICATNNNIKRISLMVNGLCQRFGKELTPRDQVGEMPQQIQDRFYTFPQVERLAQDDVFDILRYKLGFGYRAKFIHETAKQLMRISAESNFNEPRDYLMSLRQKPYAETCKQLQKFPGIGRKVADCICLMSMDHLSSVPIDCHIYEIVCRSYMKTLRQERKSLTEKVHDMIGDFFVDLHGPLAGWATSVLFVAELKHLKQNTTTRVKAKNDRKTSRVQ